MKETSNIEALGHGWNHDISRCSKARLFSWRAQPRSASSRTWFHSKQSDRLMWLIISCKKWKKWNTKYTGSVSFQKMVVTWQQLPLRAWEPTVLQLLGIPTHLHIEDQHALASPTPRSAKGVADLAGSLQYVACVVCIDTHETGSSAFWLSVLQILANNIIIYIYIYSIYIYMI